MLSFMNYENEIILNSYLKEKIAKKLDIKPQSFANSITKFLETGLLVRKGRETFIANPIYFGKGSWADIKSLRLKITYGNAGRKFETEIKKEEDSIIDNLKSELADLKKKIDFRDLSRKARQEIDPNAPRTWKTAQERREAHKSKEKVVHS